MRLIRVVAPHFVAGSESDGTVRRAAPILLHGRLAGRAGAGLYRGEGLAGGGH
jgi:hypothetical protein